MLLWANILICAIFVLPFNYDVNEDNYCGSSEVGFHLAKPFPTNLKKSPY